MSEDTELLDWMQEHSVHVEVTDSEECPIYVMAADDYRGSAALPYYDIREAVRQARAAFAAAQEQK